MKLLKKYALFIAILATITFVELFFLVLSLNKSDNVKGNTILERFIQVNLIVVIMCLVAGIIVGLVSIIIWGFKTHEKNKVARKEDKKDGVGFLKKSDYDDIVHPLISDFYVSTPINDFQKNNNTLIDLIKIKIKAHTKK